MVFSRAPSSREKMTSPSSLEVLMFDLFLFEEQPLEGPNKEVVSSLGVVYGIEAIKGCSTF